MSYQNPRNRLEVRLKEIIDNSAQLSDPRSRFELLLAAIVDSGLTPDDLRDRIELYLGELGGRASGGITPSGSIGINSNGLHNVEQYKYAVVNVPSGADTQECNFTIGATGAATHIITPPTGYLYNKVTLTRDDTVFKAENIKKNVTIYGVTGTYDSGGTPSWDQPIDLTVTVADGTYQLSLSVDVRSNTGNTLIWDTITPDEHEEDGYYHYTASFNLINGSGNIRDGFYLTCSNNFDLSSWTQNNRVYKEIYHSGQVRTWYFFVPQDATSFSIELTP